MTWPKNPDGSGGGAHVFNAVNHNGKVVWVDSQTGEVSHQPINTGAENVWHLVLGANRQPFDPTTNQNQTPQAQHQPQTQPQQQTPQHQQNPQNPQNSQHPQHPAGADHRPPENPSGHDNGQPPANPSGTQEPGDAMEIDPPEHEGAHDDHDSSSPMDVDSPEHENDSDPESARARPGPRPHAELGE
ncbi:toxin glutamine deamidase domain-containing protein [Streptomyces sp. NPDC021749]|uniref:toxin glutamine deamidase domain-containing protein n=1 Tax=Streptomyces sp. NPDC021749 TaxID=3154905 RepID=UPI0033C6BF50